MMPSKGCNISKITVKFNVKAPEATSISMGIICVIILVSEPKSILIPLPELFNASFKISVHL